MSMLDIKNLCKQPAKNLKTNHWVDCLVNIAQLDNIHESLDGFQSMEPVITERYD